MQLPTVELPKGGGALRGLGEKLGVGPTGSASFTVPLPFSPSRSPACTPQLSLSYDSASGNGPFGLGWTLSLPSIGRKTEKRLPCYRDGEDGDIFVIAGAEDLVPALVNDQGSWVRDSHIRGSHRVERYRPRIESGFIRIERWTDVSTGEAYWRAIDRDNVTSIYGRTAATRIADPADPRRVFRWLLEETRDDKGNVVAYEYKSEDTAGVDPARPEERNRLASASANRYLKRVHYGNQEPGLDGGWHFQIVFDYGEHDDDAPGLDEVRAWSTRADPFSSYRAGFEIRTWRLCRRVLLFHLFDSLALPAQLVRSLELQHTETPVVTTLSAVVQSGYAHDGAQYTKKSLPAIELGYTATAASPELAVLERASEANLPIGIGGAYQWVDLDSEGLSGVLTEQAQGWFYKRNVGGGQLGAVELVGRKPGSGLRQGTQLLDLANDGRKYVVELGGALPGYYRRDDDPDGWMPFVPFASLPALDWNSPSQRMLDLDGDGLADVLVTEDGAWSWYPSRGADGFGAREPLPVASDEEKGPVLVFSDPTQSIFLADLSGDGLVDLVRVRNGEVCYWPNIGLGRFGAKVTMSNAPLFDRPELFDPRLLRFVDIDGTGPSDLIYLGHGVVSYWCNQAGNSWSEARVYDQLPHVDSLASVDAFDFLGNGTSCLVWSSSAPRDCGRPLAYLDLMGGQKPYLLASIRNNLGAETTVHYMPSTQFYVDDRTAGKPWITRVPFPVQVVGRLEIHDLVTGNRFVSTYSYHHGYYDGPEQEFRGFARIDQLDTEQYADSELHVPPVLTKTWYHTGAFLEGERITGQLASEYWSGDPDPQAELLPDTVLPPGLTTAEQLEACRALKGLVLRQEVYALDGISDRPYSVSERGYELRLVQPRAGNPHAVLFHHPRESIDLSYERALDPRVTHAMTLSVDDYGAIVQSLAIAYPRRANAPYQEQALPRITLAETDVVNVVDQPDAYRLGVPLATRSYELVPATPPPPRYTFADIAMLLGMPETAYEAGPTAGTRRPIAAGFTLYYLDDLSGVAPYGDVGTRALPYRSYRQALTPGLVTSLWAGRVTDAHLTEAGYELRDGAWWVPSGRAVFDASRFYLQVARIDPLENNIASVVHDAYALLVVESHSSDDPALDNVLRITNDYRSMSPSCIEDPNGNRAAVRTDELGIVIASAVMGKADGVVEGDTLDDPTVRRVVDYSTIPTSVHTYEREQHGAANQRWHESYEYSDGFGRVVQKKAQAEPDPDDGTPRWVGSGRMVFNNKGKPVKQYEPFFSTTAAYEDEAAVVATGVTPVLHYDPLGRVIRTDHPDGSFSRVEVSAWQTATYDQNDTVLESRWYHDRAVASAPAEDQRAAQLTAAHAGTPAVVHTDPLGRTFLTIADNGAAGAYESRSVLDVQGRTLEARDHFGRAVMTFGYDMLGTRAYQRGMDSGERWMLNDVLGRALRSWDGRGHARHLVYDRVGRPTHAYLSSDGGAPVLVERTVYGEAVAGARDANLLGKAYRHYDGAGVATTALFDFKGNQRTGERRLARTFDQTPSWDVLDQLTDPIAMASAAEPLLEADIFATEKEYDALNRITRLVSPDGSVSSPRYNEARRLEAVTVSIRGGAPAELVSNIDYNAKGQRTRIDYGNTVWTTYAYDRDTYRLSGLVTRRASDGAYLQELAYTYDPIGNVLAVVDDAQQTVYFNNAVVTPAAHYVYDATYRLIHAEGREHLPASMLDWNDQPRIQQPATGDGQAMQLYAQDFAYDEVGNILAVVHTANQGSWNRPYHYAQDSNQLQWTDVATDAYTYDPHGNMTAMPHLASLEWNDRDQMAKVDLGGGGTAYYTYDAAGQRARKVIVRQGGAIEERLYLGGFEIYRERNATGITLERQTLHLMDDARRIALVDTLVRDGGKDVASPAPLVRLQLSNHLGSAVLEIERDGTVITYEEYYPFGSTSYLAGPSASEVPRKRYRYAGKERDDETGLYYCGARYYASWLGRWTAADPIGIGDGLDVYAYVRNNPINKIDPTGTENVPTELYDPDVKNMTDAQLYRYMKPMDEATRSLFVANTGGMFQVRAKAMADKYGMSRSTPVIEGTPPPPPPAQKTVDNGIHSYMDALNWNKDFHGVPGLFDFHIDLDAEIKKYDTPEAKTDPETAKLLAIARANKAMGRDLTADETPRSGVFNLQHGYEYSNIHDLGPTSEHGSAEEVMAYMKANPNEIFPFSIVETGDDLNSMSRAVATIEKGGKLDLIGPRSSFLPWGKSIGWALNQWQEVIVDKSSRNGVVVVDADATSFMFKTTETHFDNAGGYIRFSTFESAGHTYFMQRGWAPNAPTWNAVPAPIITAIPFFGSWEKQAANLADKTKK